MRERRRHSRVGLVASVKVFDIVNDRTHEGTIVNVGAGGLGIHLSERLGPKAPVALEFQLPPKLVLRHVQAHVIRQHRLPGGNGHIIGVAFYHLGKQLEDELATFVDVNRRVALSDRV